jgi:hypothetical protein
LLECLVIVFVVNDATTIMIAAQTCASDGGNCVEENRGEFIEHIAEGYEDGMSSENLPEHLNDMKLNWGMPYDAENDQGVINEAKKKELDLSNFYAFALDNGDPSIVDKTMASDKNSVFFKHTRTNCTIAAALFHSSNLITFTDTAAKVYLRYNRFHNYKLNKDYNPDPKATNVLTRHKYEMSREVAIPTNYALINLQHALDVRRHKQQKKKNEEEKKNKRKGKKTITNKKYMDKSLSKHQISSYWITQNLKRRNRLLNILIHHASYHKMEETYDDEGLTLLHRACFWGSGNILKNIIKKYGHWNFNVGTKHGGNTCLHFLAAGTFK